MAFYTPTAAWTSSAAGNYIDWQTATTAGTASPFTVPTSQATTIYVPSTYTVPMPSPDPAALYRHQEQVRRREWLEKWRTKRAQLDLEAIKREEFVASERARSLLFEYLDERNRQNFIDKKPLEVTSELHQGVIYHIPHLDGRIKAYRGDRVISELCLQVKAPEWLPSEDKLLTKLLYLRNDEAGALKIANHFNVTEDLRAARE